MALTYAFDPSKGETPETLKARRAIAQSLLAQNARTPQNVGEGLSALGRALSARWTLQAADKAEEAGIAGADKKWAGIDIAGAFGGSAPASSAPVAPAPSSGGLYSFEGSASAPTPDASRLEGGEGDLRGGIVETASALGIDPIDLATAISYETAGTFDPTKAGPTTQWGQHRGLIQFGEPQAQKYGVNWDDPIGSQLGADGAVANYLRDTGVQPGMGLLDIYSAINAGGVGRYGASDANNGGAPGTVRDKVEQQMADHRAKAMALMGQSPQPQGAAAAIEQQAPVQVASLDASAGMQTMPAPVDVPQMQVAQAGGVPPRMLSAEPIYGNREQIAQAMASQQRSAAPSPGVATVAQAMPRSGGIDPAIMEALSDPYMSEGRRTVLEAILKQQIEANAPMSPADRLALEKTQLEIEQMRNPQLSPSDQLARERFIYEQKQDQQPKPTDDLREYEYAKSQGYDGMLQDWITSGRKASATTINLPGQPNIGTIPQGWQAMQDPQTGAWTMSPIPGGPAAMEAEQAARAADVKQSETEKYGSVVMEDIDRATALIENATLPTTGAIGDLLAGLGGTAARDVRGLIDTVKANAGFDRLQQMREASPTGGALGQVTEREIAFLQAAIGNLEQSQSKEQLVYNLKRVRRIYDEIINGPAQAAPAAVDDQPPASFTDDPELWKYLTPEQRKLWQ